MQKLTKEQQIILTGYTGILCGNIFSEFHADVEKRLGEPVFTHMFGNEKFAEKIKELYAEDFLKIAKD